MNQVLMQYYADHITASYVFYTFKYDTCIHLPCRRYEVASLSRSWVMLMWTWQSLQGLGAARGTCWKHMTPSTASITLCSRSLLIWSSSLVTPASSRELNIVSVWEDLRVLLLLYNLHNIRLTKLFSLLVTIFVYYLYSTVCYLYYIVSPELYASEFLPSACFLYSQPSRVTRYQQPAGEAGVEEGPPSRPTSGSLASLTSSGYDSLKKKVNGKSVK